MLLVIFDALSTIIHLTLVFTHLSALLIYTKHHKYSNWVKLTDSRDPPNLNGSPR